MIVMKKLKENLFLSLVVLVYLLIFFINPTVGINSVKNSGYYIKEMLMIMPVIFILTALLDLWVPKEKIMAYLGKDSKSLGVLISFLIGSVSAGPIYAAFPMCHMLHKKGASIRNLIIILSSWAVIKIPMLLNEVKFLGPKFMFLRWILTVISIIVFSWVADKIIKDKDLPQEKDLRVGLTINENACMGCGLCVRDYPELFEMKNGKSYIKEYHEDSIDKERLDSIMTDCPVNAIEHHSKELSPLEHQE